MRAASAWKTLLFLCAVLSNACGEEPSTASARLNQDATDPQRLLSARQALVCTGSDTEPPELSIADQDLSYECTGVGNGNAWVSPEVTAVDACEGPVIVHRYNTGDDDGDGVPGMIDPDDFGPGPTTEAEGLYYAQYLAWDEQYNISGAMLSVNVRDTLAPVLTLNGGDFIQTQCFMPTDDPTDSDSEVETDPDPFVDPGATATDQCSGDLTPQVLAFNNIDKQSPGTYIVEYQVHDNASHWAEPVTRTVEVMDTLAPKVEQSLLLQLTPANGAMEEVQLSECGIAWDLCDGYLDINASAYDVTLTSNDPGHDTGDMAVLDNGKFQVRATRNANGSARVYTVSFKVSDSSGNEQQGECTVLVP